MAKKKATKQVIDLSQIVSSQDADEFESQGYDYEEVQRGKQHEFDEDLDYLLNSDSDQMSRTPSATGSKVSVSKKNDAPKNDRLKAALGLDKDTSKSTKADRLFGALTDKKVKLTSKERELITADIANIGFSSDDEDGVLVSVSTSIEPQNGTEKKKKKKRSEKKKNKANGASDNQQETKDFAESKDPTPASGPPTKEDKAQENISEDVSLELAEKPKKKKNKKKATVVSVQDDAASETSEAKEPQKSPSPNAGNRKSSAKATKLTQLPEVQPKTTIFGLSHEQIFKTKATDVKIKKILSSSMSKMCSNALDFTQAETEGLFSDPQKKQHFVALCINVALYESPGFNNVVKQYPDILEWAPTYKALTLSHTKTNLTVSKKSAHQNPLDYNVFAFIGHILLWAAELQRKAAATSILDHYKLKITKTQVVESLGGYYLWDRLRRDKTINTKRWKHIQKFRELFPFEELQFVLILRFMNLDIEIP